MVLIRLPTKPQEGRTGQLQIQVLPCAGLFDSLLFRGFKAYALMQPYGKPCQHVAKVYGGNTQHAAGVSLVLARATFRASPPVTHSTNCSKKNMLFF